MNTASLIQISEHVYWMPPAKPDRPSLCAVIGTNSTLMLDAGSSDGHAREFLEQLAEEGVPAPAYTALTHWHWDHVFGAAEIGAPVIAQRLTAEKLVELAKRDWSDEGLQAHIALGEQTTEGAENIKAELPAPRSVRIAQPSLIFEESLELRLGGVTCQIAARRRRPRSGFCRSCISCRIGCCFWATVCTMRSTRPNVITQRRNYSRLIERVQNFDAQLFVGGHNPTVAESVEFISYTNIMRQAALLVQELGADEAAVFAAVEAQTGQPPDEDAEYFLRALMTGVEFK